MAPLARWMTAAPFPVPAPADLAEAFRWSEHRTVSKTALISLHGNRYQVDPHLVGRRVELVFDPFDLTDIDVRHHGRAAGRAVPFQIGRHVHPKARTDTPPAATPSGIDYLHLVEDRHTRSLGERLHYAQLTDPAQLADPAQPSEPLEGSEPTGAPAGHRGQRRTAMDQPTAPTCSPSPASIPQATPPRARPPRPAPSWTPSWTPSSPPSPP
jgi:putative transposase